MCGSHRARPCARLGSPLPARYKGPLYPALVFIRRRLRQLTIVYKLTDPSTRKRASCKLQLTTRGTRVSKLTDRLRVRGATKGARTERRVRVRPGLNLKRSESLVRSAGAARSARPGLGLCNARLSGCRPDPPRRKQAPPPQVSSRRVCRRISGAGVGAGAGGGARRPGRIHRFVGSRCVRSSPTCRFTV